MRRTGSILIAAAIALAAALTAFAAQLETVLEEPAIEVGDSTTLRVKLAGDPGGVKPVKYPSVPGLRIEYAGMQQSYQYVNGKSWSGVELLFTVTGLRRGRYRIPSFEFRRGGQTLRSGEVALTVSAGGGGTGGGESSVADVRPSIELSSASAYVGQPIIMRYYLLSAGLRATVHQFSELPENKGFAARQVEDPQHETAPAREGEYEKTHLVTFALIPAGPGAYQAGGGSAIMSVETPSRGGRARDFFGGFGFPGFTRQQSLAFDTRPVTVMPLPAGGRPTGFQGDIGSFTMKMECPGGDIKVFEEKKVSVSISGTGNLVTMTKPALEREIPGLKVIAEEGETKIALEGGRLKGSKKFTYTLIPDKPGPVSPGRFRFTFFNPDTGRYETAESEEISFNAKSDGSGQEARFDDDPGEKKIDLNILWFALIALAIGGLVVFVVLWERRKYRLAAAFAGPGADQEEERTASDEPDHFMEAARCIETNDAAGFLKAAEKAVDLARRGFTGAVSEKAAAAVSKLKDEIYGFKYGGVVISTDDMKRIVDEIAVLRGMAARK